MWFGGLQPFTLTDFPDCIAAIAFAQGCNFNCFYCHNKSLLEPHCERKHLYSADVILDKLKVRANKLEGLVISGGEPTIQEDLGDFIQKVKRLGFKVKLDTNGSRPDILKALIKEKLLDYVAMDIKAPLHKYEDLCGAQIDPHVIQESIAIIACSGVKHHFRTTFVPVMLTEDDIRCIRILKPAMSPYVVQSYYPPRNDSKKKVI